MIDSVVFDLDGTLWDTTPACATAWNRVLARHAIDYRTIDADDVRRVTGMPHDDCIRLTFDDLDPASVDILIRDTATEDNLEIARVGGRLYPGVEEGLRRLAARFPLSIVSNCQAGYIENFFRQTGLGQHFQDFECFGNTLQPKAESLRQLIVRNGFSSPVYVGDTEGDRRAALANALPFCFVSYGFGDLVDEEFTFPTFEALVAWFLKPA